MIFQFSVFPFPFSVIHSLNADIQVMVQHGVIVRLQFFKSAMFDSTFAFVMGDPSASLSLLVSMVANLYQGLYYIFESIVVVVMK